MRCLLLGILLIEQIRARKNEPAKKSLSESSALPVQWMSRPYKPSRAANPARVIRKRMTSADLQSVGIRGDSSMSGVELVLMAHGITNRTRKTGLEKAMTIDDVSVIAALAQRAHNTNIDSKTHNPGSVPRPTTWGRSPGNGMNQRDSMGVSAHR